ncbi:hypothetical protein [Roseateles sp. P5_E7]
MSRYLIDHPVRLRDKGGVDFVPKIELHAPAQVSILGMVDPRREGLPLADGLDPNYWYQVLVESGRHKGAEGFLHTTEFNHAIPEPDVKLVESRLKGTKYGMVDIYRQDGQAEGALVVGPWARRCDLCDEVSALHVMPSTNSGNSNTEKKAQDLLQGIRNVLRASTKNSGSYLYQATKEAMIGVLQVADKNTVYASHSSKKLDTFFKSLCDGLGFVYCPPLALPILNRRGEPVPNDSVQNFDYQCAAPRLVQHAIRCGDYPVAMTEIYGGGPNEGQIIPSCGRCAKTVPFMLCPK